MCTTVGPAEQLFFAPIVIFCVFSTSIVRADRRSHVQNCRCARPPSASSTIVAGGGQTRFRKVGPPGTEIDTCPPCNSGETLEVAALGFTLPELVLLRRVDLPTAGLRPGAHRTDSLHTRRYGAFRAKLAAASGLAASARRAGRMVVSWLWPPFPQYASPQGTRPTELRYGSGLDGSRSF
jgi:hypothetical protein